MLISSWCLCAHGSDLIVAIIIVFDLFDRQGHGGDRLGKGWHTDLTGVGVGSVSAVDPVAVARGMVGNDHGQW